MMANNISVHFPEVWSKVMIKNLDNNAVMSKLVNNELTSDLAQFGDVVRLQKLGDVSVQNYTGSDFTATDVTSTDDTLVLNQSPMAAVEFNPLEEAQSNIKLLTEYTKRVAVAMNLYVDSHLLAQHANVDAAHIRGTNVSPITLTVNNIEDEFLAAQLAMDQANIPSDSRAAVVTPKVAQVIRKFLGLRETSLGDTMMAKSKITDDFCGFKVYVTTNLVPVSGVYNLMFFETSMFIHHVMRISPKNVKYYEPERNFTKGVKTLGFYGTKCFYPKAGYVIKSNA